MAESITLQTSDSNVLTADVLGRLSFAASSESSGSDAILVSASIYAQAEAEFTSTENPTSIIFATSNDGSLTSRIKIDNSGNFIPITNDIYNIGYSNLRFANSFISSGNFNTVIFNNITNDNLTEGQLGWNSTYGTLELGLESDHKLHLGQEINFRIRNQTGSSLYKGQPVYASGVHSDNIRIIPNIYVANGSIREIRFIGLVSETLDNNESGLTTNFGYIRGNVSSSLDTRGNIASNIAVGDETWAEGDILYVHPTVAGKLTKVEPKHSISVALVVRVHQTEGVLLVRPTSYGHLDDNHDVDISGVTNGQFLQYNSSTDYWVPSSSGNFTSLNLNSTGVVASTGGTTNYLSKFTASNTIGDSLIYDNGTNVGVGTSSPSANFDVVGSGHFSDTIVSDVSVKCPSLVSDYLFARDDFELGIPGTLNISDITTLNHLYWSISDAGLGNFSNLQVNSNNVWHLGNLPNAVNGTGVANHIAYWNSSSGIVADSGQLYWDDTNNRLGISTNSPNSALHVKITEVDVQDSAIKALSSTTSTISDTTWKGRIIAGAQNKTFLMGTIFDMASLGAHSWTSADAGTGAAWADLYINPDGAAKVYIGSTSSWTPDQGILTVDNSTGSVGIGTSSPGSILTLSTSNAAGTIGGASQTQIFQVNDASASDYVNLGHFNCESSLSRGSFMLSNNGTNGAWQDNVIQFFTHGMDYPHGYYGGNSSDAGCAIMVTQGSDIVKLQIGNYGAAPIEFFTSNIFRMIVDTAGNVGVGTATPYSKLQVNGSLSVGIDGSDVSNGGEGIIFGTDGSIYAYDSGPGQMLSLDQTNGLRIYGDGGTGNAVILSTDRGFARIGIGTAAPDSTLHVVGNVHIEGSLQSAGEMLYLWSNFK